VQALHSHPGLVVFALMYGNLAQYAKAQRIAEAKGNISVLAHDCAVIGRRAGPWRNAEPTDSVAGYAPAVDAVTASGVTTLRFALGDFKKFGLFLDSIVGLGAMQPGA